MESPRGSDCVDKSALHTQLLVRVKVFDILAHTRRLILLSSTLPLLYVPCSGQVPAAHIHHYSNARLAHPDLQLLVCHKQHLQLLLPQHLHQQTWLVLHSSHVSSKQGQAHLPSLAMLTVRIRHMVLQWDQ